MNFRWGVECGNKLARLIEHIQQKSKTIQINPKPPLLFLFCRLDRNPQRRPPLLNIERPTKPSILTHQPPLLRKLHALPLKQLQLHRLIHPTRRLLPIALEPAYEAITRDDAMAGHFRRVGVVS